MKASGNRIQVRASSSFLDGGGEQGARMRAHDWTTSPLGPPADWPDSLRSTVGLCLNSAFPIAIYWGPELALLYNDAWRPILGEKQAWALGRPAREVWPEIWEVIEPVLILAPVTDEAGRVLFIAPSGNDITERLRAEEGVREREKRLRLLVDLNAATQGLGDAARIMAVTAERLGRHLGVDRCAYAEVEADQDHFVITGDYCRDVQSIVGRWSMSAFGAEAHRLMLENRPYVVEDAENDIRISAENRLAYRRTNIRAVISVPLHKEGRFVAGMAVHQITPRRWLPEEVELVQLVVNRCWESTERARAVHALVEADRRKDEFIAMLSHELRNPLAPLRNALHLLRLTSEDNVAKPTQPIREMMERQVNHLVRLVDDLLETSRINRGQLELRKERVEVAAVLRSAIETSEPLIHAAGHQIDVLLPKEPLWLDGDPLRLAQVLSNLLNNAARYTDRPGRISVRAERRGDGVAIAVKDTGVGISPDVLPHLFAMFYRGDRVSGRGDAGLGIGLALARRLTEMHGGTIAAHSEGLGRGSEFVVRLPLAADQSGRSPPTREAHSDELRQRILVVDDNVDAADSLAAILDILGADVRVARSGAQALETFADYLPAVVLLDIGLPDIDGYEVARQLRRRFAEHETAIVAVTGWGQEEDRRRAREAGFDRHLVKPVEVSVLQALLASLDVKTVTA